MFIRKKFPYPKCLNGFELSTSSNYEFHYQILLFLCLDNFKYFIFDICERFCFEDSDIWPLWAQKAARIVKLFLRIKFINGSDYLSISDHIFNNKTEISEKDHIDNEQIFASRQEIFSAIHVSWFMQLIT